MCITRPDFYFQVLVLTLTPMGAGVLLLLYAAYQKILGRRWERAYTAFLFGT